ncbi:MAG TPA: hypothetical protein VF247_04225, partial [Candidatus Krumholzibacteria bacterium]
MSRRSPKTRWTVRLADRLATVSITVGGLGTILAVTGVFMFLVSVVVPLFRPGHARLREAAPLAAPALHVGTDEYRVCGWSLGRDARWRVFRLDTGDTLSTRELAPADSLAVSSFDVESASLAIGLLDGSIRTYRIQFQTDYPDSTSLGADVSGLEPGALASSDGAVIERTPEGALRRQRAALVDVGRIPAVTTARFTSMSHMADDGGFTIATIAGDSLIVDKAARSENEFTGEVGLSVERSAVSLPAGASASRVVLVEEGRVACVVDANGHATTWAAGADSMIVLAEGDLSRDGAAVTALAPLIGRNTLIVGDTKGDVRTWFSVQNGDRRSLVSPRTFRGDGSAVRA